MACPFVSGGARWLEKFTRKICVSKICRWCNILIIRITFVTISAIKGPMTIFEIAHREENNTAIYIKPRSFFFVFCATLHLSKSNTTTLLFEAGAEPKLRLNYSEP